MLLILVLMAFLLIKPVLIAYWAIFMLTLFAVFLILPDRVLHQLVRH